jgi:hypothetical protein
MKKNPLILILWLSALLASIAVSAYIANFHGANVSGDPAHWGVLGDFTGGVVGTVFSLASMILIYLTFRSQQSTSVLQQFETTFFNMLNIQREMMRDVSGQFPGAEEMETFEGQRFFQRLAASLEYDFTFFPKGEKLETAALISDYYGKRFDGPSPTLGPYYRHLYHLIKYTNDSEINQQKKYMDIIQAQMSDAELYCLFYNAICYGSERMLPLLEKYSFLENIERKDLIFDVHKTQFYPQTDFKYYTKEVTLTEIE